MAQPASQTAAHRLVWAFSDMHIAGDSSLFLLLYLHARCAGAQYCVILEQQRPLFGNRQQFTIYQLIPPGDSILNVNITIRMVFSNVLPAIQFLHSPPCASHRITSRGGSLLI